MRLIRPGHRNLQDIPGQANERRKKKILSTSFRTAKVAIPATSAGQKVPVVFHLHGNRKSKRTPLGRLLGDECILVYPQGYENSW